MGIKVSHEAYSGSARAFHRWRCALAKTIGIDLMTMNGFGGAKSWGQLAFDPLHILLDHPDHEGEILWASLSMLITRLEQVIHLLPDSDMQELTQDFIEGAKAAMLSYSSLTFS